MKKKRLISSLLTVALLLSGISITAAVAGDGNDVPVSDFTGNGTVTAVDDVIGAGAENTYVRIYDRKSKNTELILGKNDITLEKGAYYELRFFARVQDFINGSNNGKSLYRVFIDSYASGKIIHDGSALTSDYMIFGDIDNRWQGVFTGAYMTVPNTWGEYRIVFKSTADGTRPIIGFHGSGEPDSYMPLEIDELTLIKVDGTTIDKTAGTYSTLGNYILDFSSEDETEWIGTCSVSGDESRATASAATETEYFRASKPESGVTSISHSALTLESGEYTFSGEFRLSLIDGAKITFASSALTANNNSVRLTLVANGVSSVTLITNEWTTASLAFSLSEPAELTDIQAILGAALDFDFRNITVTRTGDYAPPSDDTVYCEEWIGANGGQLPFVTVDEEYIRFYPAEPIDSTTSHGRLQFRYINESDKNLEAGDYTFSVKMRYAESATYYPGVIISLNALRENYILQPGYESNLLAVTGANTTKGEIIDNAVYEFGTEWTTVTSTFTLKKAQALTDFGAVNFLVNAWAAHVYGIALDIADISLVNNTTGEEYVVGMESSYWSPNADAYMRPVGRVEEVTSHYTTAETQETSLKYIGDTEITSGVYMITGNMRASEEATVTFTAGSASDAASLDTAWAKLQINLFITADSPELVINIPEGVSIDFANIRITKLQSVNTAWASNGNTPAITVNSVLGGAESNDYIHVYDRISELDIAVYENTSVNITAGEEYTLTLYMRESGIISGREKDSTGVKIYLGRMATPYLLTDKNISSSLIGTFSNSNLHWSSTDNLNAAVVSGNEWKQYSMTFTAPTDFAGLNLYFEIAGNAEFATAFDIDGLSLTNAGGTELILTGGTWKGAAFAESTGVKVSSLTESEYARTVNETDNNTELLYIGNGAEGSYTVSGKLRLAVRELSKVAYDFTEIKDGFIVRTVTDDANSATLTAYLGETVIGTAELTNEWTEINFVFDGSFEANELEFVLDGNYNIDFFDLNVGDNN